MQMRKYDYCCMISTVLRWPGCSRVGVACFVGDFFFISFTGHMTMVESLVGELINRFC